MFTGKKSADLADNREKVLCAATGRIKRELRQCLGVDDDERALRRVYFGWNSGTSTTLAVIAIAMTMSRKIATL
jgi:hypothetical protein